MMLEVQLLFSQWASSPNFNITHQMFARNMKSHPGWERLCQVVLPVVAFLSVNEPMSGLMGHFCVKFMELIWSQIEDGDFLP